MSSEKSFRVYAFLLLVLPPLVAPLGVAQLGKWLTAGNIACCPDVLTSTGGPTNPDYLLHAYGWVSTLMLMTLIGYCGAVYAVKVMMDSRFEKGKVALKVALVVAVLLPIAYHLSRDENGLKTALFKNLFDSTLRYVMFSGTSLKTYVIQIMKTLDFVWMPPAVLLVFGAATCVSPGASGVDGQEFIKKRHSYLESLLYFGAAVLVTGLVSIHFMLNIPEAFYSTVPVQVITLTRAIEFQVAYAYSLILACLYLPVVLALYMHEKRAVGEDLKEGPAEEEKKPLAQWLPMGSAIAKIVVILSPLLAEPVIRFVTSFLGA